MSYTIGEAAELMNMSTYTLRYYDKEGLLPMVKRSESGIRVFEESDIGWLKLIECLKRSGMPIKEIKQFIDWSMEGDETLEKRRDMFHERRRIVEAQLKELKRTLDTVNYKCWYYDEAVKLGSSEAMSDIVENKMPQEIRELYENSALYQ